MLKVKLQSNHQKFGFTIVEMLIIAPIVILTIGAFVTAIVNMTGEVLATRSANVLAYSIQDALARIEEDVKLSTTFLAENNVTLTSPQGYDNNTGKFSNSGPNGDMLILNTLVTTSNPIASANSLVYYPDQPNACGSTQVTQNTPMTMNVVYFVKNNTLWRRSIMPANYLTAGCPSMVAWQQPSCAPGQTGVMCQTRDIRLIDGINATDFVIQYFNRADATTSTTIAGDGGDLEERRIALESQTTVGASINITKTAAGREISHAGSIRATKLDINASSIAQVLPPTIPSAPTVTSSFVGPDSAKFTWPQVPGADTYTVNYNINGGAYVNGASGTTNTSFTIAATRGEPVCATVYATNGAGTSPFGSACITIPLWNALVLQNSWTDYNNGYQTAGYTKTSAGIIVLKGLIRKTGTATAGEIMATLPAGYRPADTVMFAGSSIDATARIDVYAGGGIVFSTGSSGWISLEGLMFVPSSTSYTWNLFTFPSNGWVNYAPTSHWGTAGYTKDSLGRVFVRGLVAGGTTTDGTVIGSMPVGFRPPDYLHLRTTSNNTFDATGINTSGSVTPKGIALNSFRSIHHHFYASGATTWTNLTLQNGWVVYPGYAAPQYTKGADGIVTVKGLIRTGTTTSGTVIANLPVGYRPAKTALLNGACALAYCRIDVFPNGDIVARAGVSATWTALESINFIADQ